VPGPEREAERAQGQHDDEAVTRSATMLPATSARRPGPGCVQQRAASPPTLVGRKLLKNMPTQ
jgi:hypothetical protein